MAIKINNQDLQARYINGNSIGKVMLNGWQIRPETIPPAPDPNEYIRYRYDKLSYANKQWVVVPTSWIWHDWNWWVPYNWNISVKMATGSIWRTAVNYSWVSSEWWAIYIDVSDMTGRYIDVKIVPVYDSYWWALAYSWHSVRNSSAWDLVRRIYSISRDRTYKWYAVSATHTWDYFRAYQYEYADVAPAEELPDTVTTIGNYFRAWQFQMWQFLGRTEVMPDSVTSIWSHFRYQQYFNTSGSLKSVPVEAMSSNVTSIWNSFRENQFWHSNMVYQPWAEVLPSGVTSIWNRFRYWQYWNNSFSNPTTATEILPDWVLSIWTAFREWQYSYSGITTIAWWKDLAIGNASYRLNQFKWCSVTTMTTLSDVWYEMDSDDQTSVSWWWLDNMTQVNVPNAYLSSYQNSTIDPWQKMSSTVFIWY